jgi:hypothetical protein
LCNTNINFISSMAGAGASASDAGGARQTLCPRERSAAISATLHTDDQIASLRRQ